MTVKIKFPNTVHELEVQGSKLGFYVPFNREVILGHVISIVVGATEVEW